MLAMWLIEQAVRQGGSGRRRPADTALSWRNYAENTIGHRMPSGANFLDGRLGQVS
ncbi:hypothetical protein MyChFU_15870 [Mycobacterium intracellulare subsp. chimaera]|nr:hypothetical protein L842_4402 [Mycobacterium intracellulare MIN_052511_1280]